VLRSTGLRVEELLELSHYSLVQYRLPTSGEIVPLLQIAPSKTDAERLIVVSPELAEVLSSIIRRIRENRGAVPLVRARDRNEHVWLPAAPLLFQRRRGAEHYAISGATVSTLLDQALARTGLLDHEGAPLRCTPHDFRRMFITDAIRSGLPPHIAQIVAGHRKTFLATALGHIACRRRVSVHFERSDRLHKRLKAARLDASYDQEMRKLIGVDLLLIDDFSLQPLDMLETADIYELCVERHHSKSTVLTSNRDPSKAHTFERTCARWHLKFTGSECQPGGLRSRPR
jgi:integrase